jgi:NTP pyrophosphatase (non-canonical NTP hydrolase)
MEEIKKALEDYAPERKEIRLRLGLSEVLAQLAEEASELSQAALKMRRVLDGRNPTPVTLDAAESNLQEEFADVFLCMAGLVGVDTAAAERTIRAKIVRWLDRLEENNGQGN